MRQRIFLIAILLAALTACAAEQQATTVPQPVVRKPEGPSALTGAIGAWRECTFSSFRKLRQSMPDKSSAAEAAFQSCLTEEQLLMVLSPSTDVARIGLKARDKQRMLAEQ